MFDFTSFLNWKLLTGSHPFPGPDGGTCINEAAIIAAGLPYRRVCSVSDCPPCFSRPLAAYALSLNDGIRDGALRQKLLLPFVSRLAGSADSIEVESERVKTILMGVVTRVLPPSVESYGCAAEALACRSATSLEQAGFAVQRALEAIDKIPGLVPAQERHRSDYVEGVSSLISAFVYIGHYRHEGSEQRLPEAASCCAAAAITAATLSRQDWSFVPFPDPERVETFERAAELLDEAMKIGKQAEPIRIADVVTRFDRAKEESPLREPALD